MTSSNSKFSAVTGSSRKVADNAADWHNLMVRWDKLNGRGFQLATNIVNMRRSQTDRRPPDDVPSASTSQSFPPAVQQHTAAAADLQEECSKIQAVVDQMVVVVEKMERLTAVQKGLQDLEEFQFGPEGRASPLCHSWRTREFVDSAQVLLAAFSQELKLKQVVLQELAHTASADLQLVYLSCWLHQPYIPPQSRLTLEALLLETGHRPL
ncbi:cyclin-dependent kinase 2-interacting protein [Cyprinodon tularosa]|uniref:cyclin-dependent kinase 2-interacting protein n=1 Tax=Cyprinodon tularosa TaxID=77115 RepID=UPI0018E1F2D2|nr:cyclin-dependent kinase 2-interacting protein [Cyprinodon tularosa]XP_038156791.1 cyclin-dependent kinase 2-interacting protein [Cyprinodon tularosa]